MTNHQSKSKRKNKSTKDHHPNQKASDKSSKSRVHHKHSEDREARTKKELTTDSDKQQFLEAQKKIIDQYIKKSYWDLYLDLFFLFSLTITYCIILYFTDQIIAQIFIVFALICCIIIASNYYMDVKLEIEKVIKDLDVLLR